MKTIDPRHVQNAVTLACSNLQPDPHLAKHVLESTQKPLVVKKKWSVGLVVCLLLLLLSFTALAAAFLSSREAIEQTLVPMALENDADSVNDTFSHAELEHIIQLAEENGLVLSDNILNAFKSGIGYWEEETIMDLVRNEFGPYTIWTIEQKYWFEEIMVEIGFKDVNYCCLPKEGEISYDEAFALVKKQVLAATGDDIEDASLWTRSVSYSYCPDEAGKPLPPHWQFYFSPLAPMVSAYELTLTPSGEITSFQITEAPDETASVHELFIHYNDVYTGSHWAPEVWLSFSKAIKGRDPGTPLGWAMQRTAYILPPEDALTFSDALLIAEKALKRSDLSFKSGFYFELEERPFIKINFFISPSPSASEEGCIQTYALELDALTGTLLNQYMYEYKDMPVWCSSIPLDVYKSIPDSVYESFSKPNH